MNQKLYPKVTAAERRANRPSYRWPAIISALSAAGIAVVACSVVLLIDNPTAAADETAVVAKPTATPGIPVPRKPTEYSPPTPEELPGDGMWIVGKQVRPGVYQSEAGALCYWERLAGLSGQYVDLLDNGGFRKGPTLVQVYVDDYAFSSQGCGKWVLVR